MGGELGAVWPSAWPEIWVPLMEHVEFGDNLALDLFREHIPVPKSLNPISELSKYAFAEFSAAVREHEEAAADPSLAKEILQGTWFSTPTSEQIAIAFLEKSYSLFAEYDDENYANAYFNHVAAFLQRYSLRYDLRRPLTLHPTLSGMFASLIKELHKIALLDPHLQLLLGEFEDSIRDLRNGLSQARIKTCLHKQFNLLEAIGSGFPGVTRGTLGGICGQINSWPHPTVRDALKGLYGFRSDYPGLGHAGNPVSITRDLDVRDMIAIGVMLTGFIPYLSDQMNAHLIYEG
jgi:hypothetical protein